MNRFHLPYATIILLFLGIFSSSISFAQPANNECSAAITLTSNTSCINTAGTNVNATWNPTTFPGATIGCGAIDKSDVWYRFVAQSSSQTITISSAPSQIRLQLLSGTCGSFTSIACGNTSIVATGLTAGNTYYIRVYTQNSNTNTFNICVTHAPPANDNCAGATSLTSNTSCINTASTLNSATASGGTLGCFAAGTYYDVWFSFVAAHTTETITISGLGANITNPQIQLYGGTCAGLTNLSACGTTSITQSGLTVGTTYYVRVANLGTNPTGAGTVADFNICITHVPPVNDNCSGAISLTSGTSCVNTGGTLVGATYTTIPTIGCGVASRNDVWYSFVAQSTNPTITLSSAPANPRIQLFSGTCGALSSFTCSVTGTLAASGLTIGNTYFIRIYTDPNASGIFNICVTDPAPPANDNCAGAISLASSTSCVTTAGTLHYATYTVIPTIGCGVANRNDVWYSFVAQSTNPTVTLYSAFANPRIQLFSGTCGALTSVACSSTGTLAASGLTIGNTYLVRIYTDPNVAGIFNICITDPIPPTPLINDNCAGAISLASGLGCSNTTGTLIASTATTGLPVGCEAGGTHYDVWYKFVAASATETVAISGLGSNITSSQIQLYSGTCGALTSLACHANSITQGGLTVGATYYVRVSNNGSSPLSNGGFNICVTHTGAPNDLCSNSIMLTSGYTCVNTAGTTVGASYTSGLTGCNSYTANDVWYSFEAQSTTPTITVASTDANGRIQVLIYSNCGSLTCLSSTTGNNPDTKSLTPSLTIGQTYYVRVTTNNSSTTNFNLCITDPPPPPPPPSNDACSGAALLTSATSCGLTAGTLVSATISSPSVASTCSGTPGSDVWYFFVAQTAYPTISLSSIGSNITTSYIQLFSGSCGSLTSLACVSGTGTSLSLNTATSPGGAGLTPGAIYYVRIYSPSTSPAGSNFGYNICITDPPPPPPPPANDACSGAITLTPGAAGAACSSTAGTLAGATDSSPSVSSNCIGSPGSDVWYAFTATSPFNTIALNTIQSSIQANTAYLEVYSGSCGSLTSIYCVSGTGTTLNMLPGGTGLTVGNTYYVRVHTGTTNTAGSNWNFNICITTPGTGSSATIDYSKSYVNLTKLSTGGGVEPGDVLEIRATFVVRSGTVDSLAFVDTLQSNSGFTLLSSTLATQTNEGKIYKSFTDSYDSDAGWYTVNGSDTIIQMNLGPTASSAYRGSLASNSRPSVYGSTCIIMATYRVQVNATYGQKINWGGGVFTYKTGSNMKLASFRNDSLVVYASPGLCSTALSSNNQVGIESNGTFGAPSTGVPLARNRGTSTAVPSYTYATFSTAGAPTPGGGPNDYFYGIPNNTSATYTTVNTLNKATLGSSVPQRVFSHWDIIGDHTGATNTAKGNPPCDINLPVSAANPCGYMLVVNAAYKTDTAFRSTITNLCPNTYYELSAWVRNICYKCGCDSTGKGAANANVATAPAYIPFAANDSSGVPPNLAFQINGQDYYQTGNIYYTGTGPGITQAASDTVNAWVKRGFVYKTGPAETGFELVIRNNAPGGGGNDWAIDDIVVATCSPEVTVTPGPNPFVCDSNTVDVGAIIASYYDNYTHYKFEESTDDGATWTSTGVTGSVTPAWNGSAWAYSVAYPTFIAYAADSGSQYRVVISSTASNLANSSCSFSGGATVTLTVDPCNSLLDVDILSFKGRNENNEAVLYWTTSKEEEPVKYEIQKGKEGGRFVTIGEITGYKDPSAETNRYTFIDPDLLDNTISWYRIKAIKTQDNKSKYSKVIQLVGNKAGLQIESLINPFNSHVKFDIISGNDGLVQVEILDQYQHKLKIGSYNLVKGRNRINIDNTNKLPAGFYILRVTSNNNVINRKIIKRG